jgi:hypothetical protein
MFCRPRGTRSEPQAAGEQVGARGLADVDHGQRAAFGQRLFERLDVEEILNGVVSASTRPRQPADGWKTGRVRTCPWARRYRHHKIRATDSGVPSNSERSAGWASSFGSADVSPQADRPPFTGEATPTPALLRPMSGCTLRAAAPPSLYVFRTSISHSSKRPRVSTRLGPTNPAEAGRAHAGHTPVIAPSPRIFHTRIGLRVCLTLGASASLPLP